MLSTPHVQADSPARRAQCRVEGGLSVCGVVDRVSRVGGVVRVWCGSSHSGSGGLSVCGVVHRISGRGGCPCVVWFTCPGWGSAQRCVAHRALGRAAMHVCCFIALRVGGAQRVGSSRVRVGGACSPPPPVAAPLVPRCALLSGATPRMRGASHGPEAWPASIGRGQRSRASSPGNSVLEEEPLSLTDRNSQCRQKLASADRDSSDRQRLFGR